MIVKQVKIYDKENNLFHGGILLENGNVICGCCGSVIEKENIGPESDKNHQIIDVFEKWVDFSEAILN